MNIADNINERIAALSKEQRETLQHVFIHLVFVVENKELQGFFIHTLPSPPDAEMEPVLAHSINTDMDGVEEMLCNFLAIKNAALGAGEQPRSH